MFTENEQLDALYRGFNPEFARKVWERRAAEERARKVEAQAELLEAKKAERQRERESVARMRMEARARAEAEEEQRRIDRIQLDRLKHMTHNEAKDDEYKGMTAKEIIATIAVEGGMTYDDLVGVSRSTRIVAVRHRAIIEVYRQKPAMSFTQIGDAFNRDHTSILAALKKAGVRRVERPSRSKGTP